MDLEKLKAPRAKGSDAVRVKYTLSTAARERLRKSATYTGLEMSTILERLIMEHLPPEPVDVADIPIPTHRQEFDL